MPDRKRTKLPNAKRASVGELRTGLPFYPVLPEDFLDPKLLIRLSHARCLQWQCLPVCEDSAGVTVATHSQASTLALNDQMARLFDKRIYWVLCPESYLVEAIHRAFGFHTR